jgi:hypothetical protein
MDPSSLNLFEFPASECKRLFPPLPGICGGFRARLHRNCTSVRVGETLCRVGPRGGRASTGSPDLSRYRGGYHRSDATLLPDPTHDKTRACEGTQHVSRPRGRSPPPGTHAHGGREAGDTIFFWLRLGCVVAAAGRTHARGCVLPSGVEGAQVAKTRPAKPVHTSYRCR